MKIRQFLVAALLATTTAWGGIDIPRLLPAEPAEEKIARFEPSPPEVITAMLDLGEVSGKDLVFDLGSGDGRVLIAAAQQRNARGVGVDIDPELIALSRKNAEREKVGHLVEFVQGDLFKADISGATVVMLFLSPEANSRLRPWLLQQLAAGSRVVSHCHDMGAWEPDGRRTVNNHTVYAWTVPAHVAGIWKLAMPAEFPDEDFTIVFVQNYQMVDALIRTKKGDIPVSGGRLRGEVLGFTLEHGFGGLTVPARFTGRVDGNRITGTFESAGGFGAWSATRIAAVPWQTTRQEVFDADPGDVPRFPL